MQRTRRSSDNGRKIALEKKILVNFTDGTSEASRYTIACCWNVHFGLTIVIYWFATGRFSEFLHRMWVKNRLIEDLTAGICSSIGLQSLNQLGCIDHIERASVCAVSVRKLRRREDSDEQEDRR